MTNTLNTTREAATISGMTGSARIWLGLNAAGQVAQFWTKAPDVSAYPALRIAGYVCTPGTSADLAAENARLAAEMAEYRRQDSAIIAALQAESAALRKANEELRIEWLAGFDARWDAFFGKRAASCTIPPAGWHCTRAPGHDGPCAALPAPAAVPVPAASEGWTENTGEQPAVADNVLIEVEFRNGSKGGQKLNLTADCFRWALAAHDGSYDSDFDIVRWRVRPAALATSDKAEEL
jgi:hypothetical protein